MDDGRPTTDIHHITAHGTTVLRVVYTNDERTVECLLNMFEQFLRAEEYKFFGLDFEYTHDRQEKAVLQIASRTHI
jgi:hypothetical protein